MTPQPEISGYVTVQRGIRLYYRKLGTGSRTLVIPNGLILMDDFQRFASERSVIFYDVRNRGQSDPVEDAASLAGGIHNDVEDLESLRTHFKLHTLDLIGHSYLGLMVILYAIKYPGRARRIVQIGPSQPDPRKTYPPELTVTDNVMAETFGQLALLEHELSGADPVDRCRKSWWALRRIYVVDPANAEKLNWIRCELPNERNFRKYWMEHLLPPIRNLRFSNADFAKVTAPVLAIHGTHDRAAPYGGGRDWAIGLPNARLLTVPHAGHAPWIESPGVLDSIEKFLTGTWPAEATKPKG